MELDYICAEPGGTCAKLGGTCDVVGLGCVLLSSSNILPLYCLTLLSAAGFPTLSFGIFECFVKLSVLRFLFTNVGSGNSCACGYLCIKSSLLIKKNCIHIVIRVVGQQSPLRETNNYMKLSNADMEYLIMVNRN